MKHKRGFLKAKRHVLFFCFLFSVVGLMAQQKTVTGKVSDDNGETLPGATIVVKGTDLGTTTNADGQFSITNVDGASILIFSFVGMESQEVTVGAKSIINVKLKASYLGLEEVVAIGYGTQKKANLTGAVGVATSEKLENRPIVSVGQGLQGVIPGLNVSIRNGDPSKEAEFNIRGFTSINGGTPLILVDGVPMSIEQLNPGDIASVNVLKDAAAAAVYGARAAFGVILVETKKGKAGKVSVSFSSEQSLAKPIFLMDVVTDPYTFVTAWNDAAVRTGSTPFDDDYVQGTKKYSENPTAANEWGVYNNELRYYGFNDYQNKVVTDFAPQNKYDMTISGSTEKTSFYVSFGYLNKDGYLKDKENNENFKRYNVLMKADFKIIDWLSLDDKVVFNAQRNDKPHPYNWDVNVNSTARLVPIEPLAFPDLPYYLEEGDHDDFAQYIGMGFDNNNFLPYLKNGGRDTWTSNDVWLTQGITLTPIKGLKIRGDFSYNANFRAAQNVKSKIDVLASQDLGSLSTTNAFSGSDYIQNINNYNQYYVLNTYAEYTVDKFSDHFIKAMVGYNQEWSSFSRVSALANTLITPDITDLNATTGSQVTGGGKSHASLRGVFYRLNYSFRDKYLVEVNGRYDATSRFPKEDRFGFFPSVSAGWRISNEPFMGATSRWLDNLKLRVSYGELGNQILENSNGTQNYYPYISSMASGSSPFIMNTGFTPYVSAAGLVSPTLTWETVATQNFGLDISVLDQRLDFSADYYVRDTKNMLMGVNYPDILGTTAPDANAADLRTKGWELMATWRDKIGNDIRYSLTFTLSDNQTEITKYDNPTGAVNDWYVGKKVGEIWGYETEGIFQYDEDVANHADQILLGKGWQAGDILYKDLDGDGKITPGESTLDNPGDRKNIGNTTARYTFGISPNVEYKNWSLNMFFQGLFRDYLPSNAPWNAFYPFNAGHVENYYLSETWSETNRDAYFAIPMLTSVNAKNIQPQSRYVQNAAYIRLKNLTLNYNLPNHLISRVGLGSASVYLAGMNLWEFTKMHEPIDPESVETLTQEYYFQRIYSLGVKVTF